MSGLTPESKGVAPRFRSVEEALSEVERELQVRQRCYQRWCDDGKLSVVDARDRLERLAAAREYIMRYAQGCEGRNLDDPTTEAVLASIPVRT